MKALIIGATGFVGPYLAEAIKKYMYCDVTVTKLPHEKLSIPGVQIIDLNILDEGQLMSVISDEQPDYIFHLAAQSSVSRSWENPSLTVDVNVKGAINVLDTLLSLRSGIRVLVVGSGEEYGYVDEKMIPINEGAALEPGNVYAVTKATQNMMATIYAQAYGLSLTMTRSFNHIGPGQTDRFVISSFCSQVVKIEKGLQEPVIRVGNLTARRDFTDVRDVVHAYTMLAQYGKPGETYNVGRGEAVAIQDVLRLILSKSTMDIDVYVDPERLRPVDVPVIEADITKIKRDTGWKPEISLEKSIEDTLDYWRRIL